MGELAEAEVEETRRRRMGRVDMIGDEDVTPLSDRALVLKIANAQIETEVAVGALTREVAGCREDIQSLRASDGHMRTALDSVPDLAESAAHDEIQKLRDELKAQRAEADKALLEEKLASYREKEEERKRVDEKEADRQRANSDTRRNGYLIAFVTVLLSCLSTYSIEESRHHHEAPQHELAK